MNQKQKGLVDKFSSAEKIKMFFQLNWWFVWLAWAVLTISVMYMSNTMKAQNEQIKELLEKEVQGVVFVGQNGQVVFSQKAKMDASSDTSFKMAVKNNLINYLLFDASRITKNYTISIKNIDDIFKNYLPLSEFFENFISRDEQYRADAAGYYKTMLTGIVQALQTDNLPDRITPIDSTIYSYLWNDSEQMFDIVINIQVEAYIYNAAINAFDKKDGNVQIRAKGYFNISENSTLNPLGIQYTQIGITNASKK